MLDLIEDGCRSTRKSNVDAEQETPWQEKPDRKGWCEDRVRDFFFRVFAGGRQHVDVSSRLSSD